MDCKQCMYMLPRCIIHLQSNTVCLEHRDAICSSARSVSDAGSIACNCCIGFCDRASNSYACDSTDSATGTNSYYILCTTGSVHHTGSVCYVGSVCYAGSVSCSGSISCPCSISYAGTIRYAFGSVFCASSVSCDSSVPCAGSWFA